MSYSHYQRELFDVLRGSENKALNTSSSVQWELYAYRKTHRYMELPVHLFSTLWNVSFRIFML